MSALFGRQIIAGRWSIILQPEIVVERKVEERDRPGKKNEASGRLPKGKGVTEYCNNLNKILQEWPQHLLRIGRRERETIFNVYLTTSEDVFGKMV